MSTPPLFIHVGGRIINASQIKWAGMQTDDPASDVERVHIEFITGGFTRLPEGLTLEDVDKAMYSAVMSTNQS